MRRDTVYITTPHGRLEAWLYIPSTPRPWPVVVLGCGVGAVKAAGLEPFATAFQAAGFASVAFDYMGFGGSDGKPRHLVSVAAEYRDFQNVVAWVKGDSRFDSSRIVVWGTSFGGMHVTRLLAEDTTIAAGIAQCPCVDGYLASRLKPLRDSVSLTTLACLDWLLSFLSDDPIYVQAAATAGSNRVSLMNAPDVVSGWQLLHKGLEGQYVDPYSNRIVARSVLSFPMHRPALRAAEILAPYLIVVSQFDSVAPKPAAVKVANDAAYGEVVEVPGGHFDLYKDGIGFEDNLAAQLEFLRRVIPLRQ
ncbi:hypothetical protein NLG97_g5710 [Lecanicillium saksenae]|uniref:Uncharacterized protein n=1 Tax=Lecanicillium saksenae TaxID=468837 RepID=A0ACC1QT21_9HYPO|nr:hypothetical protein NLG97_g5710 [Lecanicillium saksenae]